MSVFVNFFMPAILVLMGFIALAVERTIRQKNSPSLKGPKTKKNNINNQGGL